MDTMVRTQKNQTAFTLMEIMVTVVIIGVLSAMAIPNLALSLERSRVGEAVNILNSLLSAQRILLFETGAYTNNINNLSVTIPQPANFFAPTVFANGGNLASIRRNNGNYTICIDENGRLSCVGVMNSCVAVNIPAPVFPSVCG
jgi:prepilin-type N-terminal cleavage/methylation domain-containing protein